MGGQQGPPCAGQQGGPRHRGRPPPRPPRKQGPWWSPRRGRTPPSPPPPPGRATPSVAPGRIGPHLGGPEQPRTTVATVPIAGATTTSPQGHQDGGGHAARAPANRPPPPPHKPRATQRPPPPSDPMADAPPAASPSQSTLPPRQQHGRATLGARLKPNVVPAKLFQCSRLSGRNKKSSKFIYPPTKPTRTWWQNMLFASLGGPRWYAHICCLARCHVKKTCFQKKFLLEHHWNTAGTSYWNVAGTSTLQQEQSTRKGKMVTYIVV